MNLPVGISFNEELRLLVFRPLGIFDAKKVAEVVEFLEDVEDRLDQPFNRFTDTSKMSAVDLDESFIYRIALHTPSFLRRHAHQSSLRFTSPAPPLAIPSGFMLSWRSILH